ncbi:hypothetical protein [Flavimaricola marinus]|uniref:hypothetical protein n=1 Tax=Flavimaricola marinus TaxID=1819565 RepID=UPI001054E671|nr:hypothetical protein [Flavimaricola marinus]
MGQETFGDEWRLDTIENPKSIEHRETLTILRNALRSGDVGAHWTTQDLKQIGDLRPQDADQEYFRFMLREDLVFHHGMNEPVKCRIHAHQLRRILRGDEALPVNPTLRDKRLCFEWLVEMLSDQDREIPPFALLRQEAKKRFPRLSDRAFKEARKLAIEHTGRADLAKPGRRKNQISK